MAAFELCTIESFGARSARDEDSAVCSYLQLLGLLVTRVEDVQELRARGLLKGRLTNEEALHFFTSFQSLRFGPCYNRVMRGIEIYKKTGGCRPSCMRFVTTTRKSSPRFSPASVYLSGS